MGWDGPITNRQYRTWNVWLEEQWNCPSRTDYYLMRIVCEIQRILAKNPGSIKLDDARIKFSSGKKPSLTEDEKREASNRSKQFWLGFVGAAGTKPATSSEQPQKPVSTPPPKPVSRPTQRRYGH